MDDVNGVDQDDEFGRYLQILESYLGRLGDEKLVELCNAWILRLSACRECEKYIRNKYTFALCCQLCKGALDEPFTKMPSLDSDLPPLLESNQSENSSEVEYAVINPHEPNTSMFDENTSIASESNLRENEASKPRQNCDGRLKTSRSVSNVSRKILHCNCRDQKEDRRSSATEYEFRTASLIRKLREIKAQNSFLHNELESLRQDAILSQNICEERANKTDHSTSTVINNDSNATLNSYKTRIKEVQASRNSLIDIISELQNKLDNFEELKTHEINDIEAKHKLEMINLRSTVREEVTNVYEQKLEQLKIDYEIKLKGMQEKIEKDVKGGCACKSNIAEKTKIIQEQKNEIAKLKSLVAEQNKTNENVLSKTRANSTSPTNNETDKLKAQVLEKRLYKLERAKLKCTKCYENKLKNLNREKNLAECTMQLHLVKHRAQVARETTDENQIELNKALDKLESKYKEIVANVQSTAIHRRMQDQIALDSILQAACGIQSVCPNANSQFSGKTVRNQNRSCDTENLSVQLGDKVENKSIGADSLIAGYCLDGERMEALFQRLYITQDGRGLK